MFVKAWGPDKAEVDLSFGRRGRHAMDGTRELEEWAQLAAERANGYDSPTLVSGAKGTVTVQPLDAARLQFPVDPAHFDGAERLPPGMSIPYRQWSRFPDGILGPIAGRPAPDTAAATAENLTLLRQWSIADRLWLRPGHH